MANKNKYIVNKINMESIIDPKIAKSIKLLLSSDPLSTEQLRLMLEESIRAKFESKKVISMTNMKFKNSNGISSPKREPLIHLLCDPSAIVPEEDCTDDKLLHSYCTDDNDELTALEMFEENLCVVCKIVTSTSSNRIVECLDCHKLYHQACAKPKIEADVDDPRFKWYCHNCNKGTKKIILPPKLDCTATKYAN